MYTLFMLGTSASRSTHSRVGCSEKKTKNKSWCHTPIIPFVVIVLLCSKPHRAIDSPLSPLPDSKQDVTLENNLPRDKTTTKRVALTTGPDGSQMTDKATLARQVTGMPWQQCAWLHWMMPIGDGLLKLKLPTMTSTRRWWNGPVTDTWIRRRRCWRSWSR